MQPAAGMPPLAYLDSNATTRPHERAVLAVVEALREGWGNPSSIHAFGSRVGRRLDAARETVAAAIGAEPSEVVFTSGATEALNAAIRGALALGAPAGRRHVVTTRVEHPSVLGLLERLEREGACEVTRLGVAPDGRLAAGAVERALRPDTALAAVMWANNETGVLFPVDEIARACRARGVPFLTDATQAVGRVPVDLRRTPADLLALSGHKVHGPKGIGVLGARRGLALPPLLAGGHQERGRRAGTENVPGILGLAAALEALAVADAARVEAEAARTAALRDRFEAAVLERVRDAARNGAPDARLPNTSSLRFRDVDGEALVLELSRRGICVSSGSACTSGSLEPSPVLLALGLRPQEALGSLRVSLSRETTAAEVDRAAAAVVEAVSRLRLLAAGAPGGRARTVLE